MEPDVITTWAWVVWLALILIFIIVEVNTLEFTFLMLALGSVGGLVTGLIGAPWWMQLIVAAVLAQLLIFVVRPPLLQRLRRGGDPTPSNVEALLGLGGTVTLTFQDGAGQVKLSNGDIWSARLASGTSDTEPVTGTRVVVTAIEGATAVVAPAETAPASASEGNAS